MSGSHIWILVLAGALLTTGLPSVAAPVPAAAPPGAARPQGQKKWIPGHYETREMTVRVPATTRRVWVPPVYRTSRDRQGNPIQVLVRAGHWETVSVPATVRKETRRVWVPGRWVDA